MKYKLIFLIALLPCLLYGQKKPAPPPVPPDYLKQGNDYYARENYKQALDSYNRLLTDSTETPEVSFGLGRTYLKLGDFEQGMSCLIKAAGSNKKYAEYLLNLDYDEIPFNLLKPNFLGDKLVRKVSNGLFISPVFFISQTSSRVIDEATSLPLWNQSVEVSGYGAEISFAYNPLSVSLTYLSGEGSLKNVKKRFALPPSLPGQESLINTNLQVTSVSGGLTWTPAVIFWGYFYPFCGASFLMNQYKNQVSTSYSVISADAGLLIKYKKLFLKGIYKQPLDNKVLDSQIQIQAGIMFNFFN